MALSAKPSFPSCSPKPGKTASPTEPFNSRERERERERRLFYK
jgi:hypothetical protein